MDGFPNEASGKQQGLSATIWKPNPVKEQEQQMMSTEMHRGSSKHESNGKHLCKKQEPHRERLDGMPNQASADWVGLSCSRMRTN